MSALPNERMANLRGPVLQSVSRSFYLSIRLLPRKLRDPIALAYLLARATDTIADTVEIPAAVRMEELARLASLIQGQELPPNDANPFEAFASLQAESTERVLIEAIPECLRWLGSLPLEDQTDIREVLAYINEGQTLDVHRFANAGQVAALATAADLDRYTFLVAGSVGQFWTHLCQRRLRRFSDRPAEEMLSLGEGFGKGLQLLNIIRDAGDDLRAGRCYFPADELERWGLEPRELLFDPRPAAPVVQEWRRRAESGMRSGIEYACAVRSWRVRMATALPALIGARTLALLSAAGAQAFHEKVKMPREEVRPIIVRVARNLASPKSLRVLFAELSG